MSAPYAKLPAWADYGLIPVLNLVAAFLVGGLVVLMAGENPIEALMLMFKGAFGSGNGIGYTLYYATTFIFTGLAVAVAFHCGLFNIGGEGQAYIAGLGVAVVCLAFDNVLPWWLTYPLAIAAAALVGAAWALIPAWLQATRGSHIVITTIMFNFIAASIMVYMLVNVFKPAGIMSPETRPFGPGADIPSMAWLMQALGFSVRTTPFNITFIVAILAAVGVWTLIWRTRLGYEIRTMGHSPRAARYAGIGEVRIIIITMLISGALAGLMALNPIMGAQGRMQINFVAGAGFVGIAVALMGRSHPFGIVLAAILFGMLYQGGAEISFAMPNISRDMIVIIQGLVILFAGAMEHMFRPTVQAIFASLSPRSVGLRAAEGQQGR
ncbi:MAG: ABC transporter permease [Pseudomonadota bacterium]|nr:ABC transporter permease [Pseudomonadota bacterium]